MTGAISVEPVTASVMPTIPASRTLSSADPRKYPPKASHARLAASVATDLRRTAVAVATGAIPTDMGTVDRDMFAHYPVGIDANPSRAQSGSLLARIVQSPEPFFGDLLGRLLFVDALRVQRNESILRQLGADRIQDLSSLRVDVS